MEFMRKEGKMKTAAPKKKTGRKMAKFWIWTIRNHDIIAANIRIYMFAGVAVILLLGIGGAVHLKAALNAILLGGLGIAAILWVLIENRRASLLNIVDPDLREDAHIAMIDFLALRRHKLKKRKYIWNKIVDKFQTN